jgi:hypothetical protein
MFIAYKRILFFGSFLEKNEFKVKIEKIIKEFKAPFD